MVFTCWPPDQAGQAGGEAATDVVSDLAGHVAPHLTPHRQQVGPVIRATGLMAPYTAVINTGAESVCMVIVAPIRAPVDLDIFSSPASPSSMPPLAGPADPFRVVKVVVSDGGG